MLRFSQIHTVCMRRSDRWPRSTETGAPRASAPARELALPQGVLALPQRRQRPGARLRARPARQREPVAQGMCPGGILAVNFFGPHDTWAGEEGMSFHSEAEVREMLDGLRGPRTQRARRGRHERCGAPSTRHVFDWPARQRSARARPLIRGLAGRFRGVSTLPRPQPPPGLTVGGYTLLTRLGEGGMGVVHLARAPGGERVALKVLRPHIVGDDEARARLAREVSSLTRIRSRWVAEIVDADPWGDDPVRRHPLRARPLAARPGPGGGPDHRRRPALARPRPGRGRRDACTPSGCCTATSSRPTC